MLQCSVQVVGSSSAARIPRACSRWVRLRRRGYPRTPILHRSRLGTTAASARECSGPWGWPHANLINVKISEGVVLCEAISAEARSSC